MSQDPSTSRRTGLDVQREIVAGLQSLVLTDDVELDRLIGMGGYAEVYEGSLLDPRVNMWTKVAVKRFRVIMDKEKEFAETFSRELCIWAKLQHENVLKLVGMVVVEGTPALASEWMQNGTMNDYLKMHSGVDLLELARGIACGLEYLHNVGVVHSDLKGDNVLMTDNGRPVLSDFGISRLLVNSKTFVGTTSMKGNIRWMAPELVSIDDDNGERTHHTKASDVWAFGMVLYEALSRNVPYHTKQNEAQVILLIANKRLPTKPEVAREGSRQFEVVWECCCECWKQDPKDRPMMSEVRERLKGPLFVEHISSVSTEKAWMSPTGRFLAVRDGDRKSISILETKTMSKCGPGLKVESAAYAVAWSNSEEYVVTRSFDGILQKWSNILEEPVVVAQTMQTHEGAFLEFSLDDRFIASFYETAKLWDASNLSFIWQYPGYWSSVAFHPLGNRIVFHLDRSLLDVNIEDLRSITATRHGLEPPAENLVFDPSGHICVARSSRNVRILSGETFEEMTSLPYADCKAAQFTPNGKHILFVLWPKEVVLWDITVGEAVEKVSLPMDLDSVSEWKAKISKNCRVIQLDARTGSVREKHVFHLMSSYY